MRADLHVHSHYSDGSDSVEEVLQKARRNDISHISFVDHDTTASLAEALTLGKQYGIEVIPGIEISAFDFKRNRKVHILGYGYNEKATHIQALCNPLLERRHRHSIWQIEQIEQTGYELDRQSIFEYANMSNVIYKQHIMHSLTKHPFSSKDYQQLYQMLFKGGVAKGDIYYVDAIKAIQAIKADGGMAVLAHPGQLDSYDFVPALVEAGLDGIERNHFEHSEEDHFRVEQLCEKYNLFMTGGSDYHGSYGRPMEVGELISPKNKVNVKENYTYR
ncbi:phosphoesterase [Alkalihalobacillus alcalophilus ATCC 27647 = CGMCC 1.3604]|uniref:Phosphoesterase n=1 Tax=Alkalihalobacillus alcalophilus ATCC 27647 = CGMCC 1.3604 TaxID=1218173 RepID=A0A094WQD7_ALKAL|nr:PHP domain-containing protein [Alkalihalobacillus alcalophilus]KGA99031.1 phosphoesterase [Alkalihalobacillus alcalophilus ATCC 27647 = CGMCC 1.3604]MED1560674.1 PHP domain-containing protein [Alkalihalobacillus alcalophilus]THG89828.1 phosphoesterase [Alkalihalobacillus alcalophilus ATCC 27647 = CGMCC 1.3604]